VCVRSKSFEGTAPSRRSLAKRRDGLCETQCMTGMVPQLPLRLTGPGGSIRTPWSWFAEAPPKDGERHWKDGRSALELARAWCRSSQPQPPAEFLEALGNHPDTAGFTAWDAVAELVTPLPLPGEGRNHDLAVVGVTGGIPTFVGVEAKAGEPFGDRTIRQYWMEKFGSKSNVPARIAALVDVVFGAKVPLTSTCEVPDGLGDRGYQLLTAAAGTMLEARRRHCRRAVLLVHEFRPSVPTAFLSDALELAQVDLDAFAALLLGKPSAAISSGTIVGPASRIGGAFAGVQLYVGKCVTSVD